MIPPMAEPITLKKKILFTLIGLSVSGLLTLILLEIAFRFLPVTDTFSSQPVTFEQPVARFKPNQEVTWSRDSNFAIVSRRRINNDGFFNDQDYDPEDTRPLMTVIGDSYVEAVMVPYEETLYGRLSETVGAEKRIYSFGASGAPLSQYLIWAKYAKEAYKPSKMVFVIVGNDFDESLPQYTFHQTFHQFAEDENGKLRPTLMQEYHPSAKRVIVQHSALLRYLLFNVQLYNTWNNLRAKLVLNKRQEEEAFIGNVPAHVSDERLYDSQKAVDAFFDNLPDYAGLRPRDIAFIVDAPRYQIYEADKLPLKGDSYFENMRSYFLKEARKRGYTTLDMTPAFFDTYQKDQQKFEYPTDGHWSGYGHEVVHEALIQTRWFKRF